MVSAALPREILQSNQHAKVNNRQSVVRHCTVFSHLLAPDIHNRNPAGPITCRLKQTAFSSREYLSCGTSSGRPRAGPKVNLLAVALGNMRMGISESRARFHRTAIRYSSRPGAGWVLATFSPDDFATGGMYVRRPRVLPGLLAVMSPQCSASSMHGSQPWLRTCPMVLTCCVYIRSDS